MKLSLNDLKERLLLSERFNERYIKVKGLDFDLWTQALDAGISFCNFNGFETAIDVRDVKRLGMGDRWYVDEDGEPIEDATP